MQSRESLDLMAGRCHHQTKGASNFNSGRQAKYDRRDKMSTKIIVSYDGTANEDDAISLGRLLGGAGAQVALAYVRHTHEPDGNRETLAQADAQELLDRGAQLLGDTNAARHVVTDRSTPEGLRALAEQEGAEVIVFCSDSHTAKGHVAVGNSAERLLEGGRTAVAIAPVDLGERIAQGIRQIVAISDGDGGARETAQSLAGALGASVAPVVNEQTDLLVIDSRPEAEAGRVALNSSAAHLIEIATCPVLVLPRGVALSFGARSAAGAVA
jgi:nucleotide-binding universal stress UspA family protein